MFERFSETAIKTIMVAQVEARRLGHSLVGPEHIFLGLIGANAGETSKALKLKGISLDRARDEVEKKLRRNKVADIEEAIHFNDEAKRALEQSWEEAKKLGHRFISDEHLLLGLVADTNGMVSRILERLGETPCSMTKKVMEIIPDKPPNSTNL
jgi:ATP-dependent Clp protease ATP-binding subunit ClpC